MIATRGFFSLFVSHVWKVINEIIKGRILKGVPTSDLFLLELPKSFFASIDTPKCLNSHLCM